MTIPGPVTDERLPIYTSNTFEIPGLELEQHIGLCWGLIVISLGFGRSLAGGFRSLAAGEVTEFTQAVDEARRGALFRMIDHTKALGGNAVVGVTFDSNSLRRGRGAGRVRRLRVGGRGQDRLTREGRPKGRPSAYVTCCVRLSVVDYEGSGAAPFDTQ
jgi:uncharacterized protein YbjQ (UPF0145 family)